MDRKKKSRNKLALLTVLFVCNHMLAATSTLTFTKKCNGNGTADDGAVWTISSDGSEASYNNGIRYGSGSDYVSYLILSTNKISGTITQVKVNACGNESYDTKVEVRVGGTSFIWTDAYSNTWTEVSLLNSPANVLFTGSASGEIQVRIRQARAKSSICCKSIEVTYTADMTVANNETKTISVAQSVENLTIESGGRVELSDRKMTVKGDFIIQTTMGSGSSGQLVGATNSNFEVQGDTYIDITLGDDGNPAKWHAFTVPFPVDARNGIYDTEGHPLTNETHYAIMDYHGDLRANGQYGWKRFTGTMTPGTFYLITVDGERSTYRLKKAAGDLLSAAGMDYTHYTGSSDAADQGWNGLGNPTLAYCKVAYPVQVLDPEYYVFETKPANACNFVVGTPFFYQAAEDGSMLMLTADASAFYAPKCTTSSEPPTATLTFSNADYTDYLYLSADENASDTYEIGKDLAKMTMTAQPSVPQLFSLAYDIPLSMVHAPLIENQATIPLSLYAPREGTYTIAAQDLTNAELYLMHNGMMVQDLENNTYDLSLPQGENHQYELILRAKSPQMTTEITETSSSSQTVKKLIINNHIYILREGKMYDLRGNIIQ